MHVPDTTEYATNPAPEPPLVDNASVDPNATEVIGIVNETCAPFAAVEVAVEVAVVVPIPFVLLTRILNCLPTSDEPNKYVDEIAAATSTHTHDAGFGHTCHW